MLAGLSPDEEMATAQDDSLAWDPDCSVGVLADFPIIQKVCDMTTQRSRAVARRTVGFFMVLGYIPGGPFKRTLACALYRGLTSLRSRPARLAGRPLCRLPISAHGYWCSF